MDNQRSDDNTTSYHLSSEPEARVDVHSSSRFGMTMVASSNLHTSTTNSRGCMDVPLTESEKKRKQIFNRAKAMPITKTQKRARWVPGHRYMPILLVQRLWHPFSSLLDDRKSGSTSGHVNDNKLHQDHYHHQHHHQHHHHHDNLQIVHSASVSPVRSRRGSSNIDMFME